MTWFEMARLRAEDEALKIEQTSQSYLEDVGNLSELFDGQLRAIQKNFERAVKLGDPQNPRSAAPSLARRLARAASVLYWVPPTRRLRNAQPEASASLRKVVARSQLDAYFDVADAKRQLVRQVFVMFSASTRARRVLTRTFTAPAVMRRPSLGLRDVIEEDEVIAFRTGGAVNSPLEQQRWQLWLHKDSGAWEVAAVDGAGNLRPSPEQPFAIQREDGSIAETTGAVPSPYGEQLPVVMLTDEILDGRAWLPIPQHRLDLILNVSALAADVLFMAKFQAHSIRVGTAAPNQSTDDFPEESGPDTTTVLPNGAKLEVLNHQPQFDALNTTMDRLLSLLALSESLPPDAFSLKRSIPLSTPALRFIYAESDRRRSEQVKPTATFEQEAFRAYATVWLRNFPAEVPGLDPELELQARFAPSWAATDRREHQDTSYRDMQAGLLSPIRYVQERDHCDRETAFEEILQSRADLALVPPLVAPGSLADGGPRAALGPGSATGSGFTPDPASSVEGASVVAALVRAQEVASDAAGPLSDEADGLTE